MPDSTLDSLDRLAGLRMGGNRSAMLAYAVDLTALVLDDPALADRLLSTPEAALAAAQASHGGR
jgi:hypothetical protein